MIDAAIVPDGEVVDVGPPVANLQIMVLDNQTDEPVQEVLRLVVRETVDVFHVVTHGEHRLPAGDRVGPHNRVNSLEHVADVLGSTACGSEELEVVLLRCCVEIWLGVVGCERVEEAPECWRDAVIELIARGPQSI